MLSNPEYVTDLRLDYKSAEEKNAFWFAHVRRTVDAQGFTFRANYVDFRHQNKFVLG